MGERRERKDSVQKCTNKTGRQQESCCDEKGGREKNTKAEGDSEKKGNDETSYDKRTDRYWEIYLRLNRVEFSQKMFHISVLGSRTEGKYETIKHSILNELGNPVSYTHLTLPTIYSV